MANPNGAPQNLQPRPPWQKGQSGNPAGYSRKRRIADAVNRIIEEKGLDTELGMVALAKATGRRDLLIDRDKDGKPKKNSKGQVIYRKPEAIWFKMVCDMVDGPMPKYAEDAPQEAEGPTIDPETAAKILKAIGGSGDDDGPTD